MTRTVPSWFRKWLRNFDPDLRAQWNEVRRGWEIVRIKLDCIYERQTECPTTGIHIVREFRQIPHVELTWPHNEVCEATCEKLRRGANWLWSGRAKDVWRERFSEPARRFHDSRRKDYNAIQSEVRKDVRGIVKKASGKRVTIGAVKNEKIGNPI